jgi:hypothetical protein
MLLQVSHEVVDDILEMCDGFSGEMGIPECGCNTAMAEYLLDEANISASLQKMGCIGVPQGMDGGVFRNAALLQRGFEGLLQAHGGDGTLFGRGGKKPDA